MPAMVCSQCQECQLAVAAGPTLPGLFDFQSLQISSQWYPRFYFLRLVYSARTERPPRRDRRNTVWRLTATHMQETRARLPKKKLKTHIHTSTGKVYIIVRPAELVAHQGKRPSPQPPCQPT